MTMSYAPGPEAQMILHRALQYVREVPYTVTARWVFYRLLQDGTLASKADYKRLLGYLSKARKNFYDGWTPSTLGDDTREPLLRGYGYDDGAHWLSGVRQMECSLDRWVGQDKVVEVWFEAAAMAAQFEYYVNPNVTLLAFHGDVSIPAKWEAAVRIAERWWESPDRSVHVLYYGDLDPKGLQIPYAAEKDVKMFAAMHLGQMMRSGGMLSSTERQGYLGQFLANWNFKRIGLNDYDAALALVEGNNLDDMLLDDHLDESQVGDYNVPENPERPGTYQWEGVPDGAAQDLIARVDDYLDINAFEEIEANEADITERFRAHLDGLDLS